MPKSLKPALNRAERLVSAERRRKQSLSSGIVQRHRRRRSQVSHTDFVGTQMANMLASLSQQSFLPEWYRRDVEKLYKRWDSICLLRLNNPIVAAELEKELFPND